MNTPEQEHIEQNIRRTAGLHALRQVRRLVDEEERKEETRRKLLRAYAFYGGVILLALALLLGRQYGVF